MSDWVAVVYVGFKLCILYPDKSAEPHPQGWEIWVRPDAVTGFARVREQLSGIPCSRINVGGERVYVVGSPREVYEKLTVDHSD